MLNKSTECCGESGRPQHGRTDNIKEEVEQQQQRQQQELKYHMMHSLSH